MIRHGSPQRSRLQGPQNFIPLPSDQEQNHLELEIKSLWQKAGKNPRSNAKRKGIGKLPLTWRADFWKNFPENSPHRLALALLSTTGCRPSELVKGVQLKLDEHGTKVSEEPKPTMAVMGKNTVN
jgi:hypothetical protein